MVAHFCIYQLIPYTIEVSVWGVGVVQKRALLLLKSADGYGGNWYRFENRAGPGAREHSAAARGPFGGRFLRRLRHLATDISLLTNERRLYVCYGIRLTASALWLSIPLRGSSLHFLTHVCYYSTNKIKFLQFLIRGMMKDFPKSKSSEIEIPEEVHHHPIFCFTQNWIPTTEIG